MPQYAQYVYIRTLQFYKQQTLFIGNNGNVIYTTLPYNNIYCFQTDVIVSKSLGGRRSWFVSLAVFWSITHATLGRVIILRTTVTPDGARSANRRRFIPPSPRLLSPVKLPPPGTVETPKSQTVRFHPRRSANPFGQPPPISEVGTAHSNRDKTYSKCMFTPTDLSREHNISVS